MLDQDHQGTAKAGLHHTIKEIADVDRLRTAHPGKVPIRIENVIGEEMTQCPIEMTSSQATAELKGGGIIVIVQMSI